MSHRKGHKPAGIRVYSDGGCHGKNQLNGPIWGSFKVGDLPIETVEFDVLGSNNVAEYLTAIAAMEYCRDKGIKPDKFLTDSMLVAYHINGWLDCNDERLYPLCEKARLLLVELGSHIDWTCRDNIVRVLGH